MNWNVFIFYLIGYSITVITIFIILLIMGLNENIHITNLAGLFKLNPFLSFIFIISMLNLSGIPPLFGFYTKLYLFNELLLNGYFFIVIVSI